MKKSLSVTLILCFLLSGCGSLLSVAGSNPPVETTAALPPPSETPLPTATPRPSETLVPTATLLPTSTSTLGPTATWAAHEAKTVVAPILLYHHINDDPTDNRYVISTATFTAQLQALKDWGYTAIPISTLVEVLINGGPLPERPVVITFDDGNMDVYQNAFPIMKRFGDPGTFFIIASWLGAPGYVGVDELKEMTAAGWEIGSHSWSHVDVTTDPDKINKEVAESRLKLEEKLGVPVKIFSYPFGAVNPEVSQKVQEYGYRAAVGLGITNVQTWGNMYYLNRQEVRRDYDMEAFRKLLPSWGE